MNIVFLNKILGVRKVVKTKLEKEIVALLEKNTLYSVKGPILEFLKREVSSEKEIIEAINRLIVKGKIKARVVGVARVDEPFLVFKFSLNKP